MFNVKLDYPSFDEEVLIVKQTTVNQTSQVNRVLSGEEILAFQESIRHMPVPDNVVEYAVRLVTSSRTQDNRYISWGAGPRASQYLIVGARCHAAIHGKYSPDAEDVNAVAFNVLRHRIVRNYYAEAEGVSTDDIIKTLIQQV